MLESELSLFSKGLHKDPLVTKYQHMISESDEIIFIFPIWWNTAPAILKGFIDKVMLKGFSYKESTLGLTGTLTHIKRAKVITTSQAPVWYIKLFAGDTVRKVFIKATLKVVGIKNVKWLHCGEVTKGKKERREKFLLKVKKTI
jgi:NAD(P)H dehydrogenase (quinone)